MNAKQFEQEYAKRSKISVRELHRLGLYIFPCHCSEEGCRGFQMTNPRNLSSWELEEMPKSYQDKAIRILDKMKADLSK